MHYYVTILLGSISETYELIYTGNILILAELTLCLQSITFMP